MGARISSTGVAAWLLLTGVSAATAADERKPPQSQVLQGVLKCRAITDDAVRLRCFDAGVAQLDNAQSKGEVAVVDRAEVNRTRRALFGFTLPNLTLFSSRAGDPIRNAEADDLKEITGTIASARQGADGWQITMEGGGTWVQTDDTMLGRAPKRGMAVTIRRGVLGSFKMDFPVGPGIKVKRVG